MSTRWTGERAESKANKDSAVMTDTSSSGEAAAQKMLTEIANQIHGERFSANIGFPDVNEREQKQTEECVNAYITRMNANAEKAGDKQQAAGNPGYNLKFELVDDQNKDGKWNYGDTVRVKNEAKYWFDQAAKFDPLSGKGQVGTNQNYEWNNQSREAAK